MVSLPKKKLFAKTEGSEEPPAPFKYERLRSTEMKLLRLQPYGFRNLISVSLNIILLHDDNGSISTESEALSKSGVMTQSIAPFRLTTLRYLLNKTKPGVRTREFCKGKVESLLWSDAICINQADIIERNRTDSHDELNLSASHTSG